MNMYNVIDINSVLHDISTAYMPAEEDLVYLLSRREADECSGIFDYADAVRRRFMGDGVLLRGLVEFSSYCTNSCFYCGLSAAHTALKRYRLTTDEVIDAVAQMSSYGIRTVVLQSGEDAGIDASHIAELIETIKSTFGMAVTLSVGERTAADYRLWKRSGADRYLLRIETTDKGLYESMHAGRKLSTRLACLETLRDLGYQVGSGIMVGLRGQTLGMIARDIQFFKKAQFDMIGIGPFIPHSGTVFGNDRPGSVELTLKVIALARIVTRNAHMPATTALGSMGKDYRMDGLKAGANVLMPNFTPQPYKELYEIYPNKRCVSEKPGVCVSCLGSKVQNIGRAIDLSVGHSLKH